MNFRLGKAHDEPLNRQTVLNRVSEQQLYTFYLGPGAKPGNTVKSPFRRDTHASMSLYRAAMHNKIMWKDQATGEFGDIFDIVSMLHGTDLYGALLKINEDFDLGYIVPQNYVPTQTVRAGRTSRHQTGEGKAKIGIKAYQWSQGSLWYWSRYGIGEELLRAFNVFPARWATINERRYWDWKPESPIYAYLFHKDGEYTWKVYRPLADKNEGRWISNTNPSILQGWEQLPATAKRLIITKSMKDVMVLRTLGEYSLAMQQEISTIKPSVMKELLTRFQEIWLLQDLEYAGVRGAAIMRRMYPQVHPFFIQCIKTRGSESIGKSFGLKDISDYRERHTLEETRAHLLNCMKAWRESTRQV